MFKESLKPEDYLGKGSDNDRISEHEILAYQSKPDRGLLSWKLTLPTVY